MTPVLPVASGCGSADVLEHVPELERSSVRLRALEMESCVNDRGALIKPEISKRLLKSKVDS